MKKGYFLACVFAITSLLSFAQKGYVGEVNKLNSIGQKDGFWIEDRKVDKIYLYYRNGVRSGVFRMYSNDGRLRLFGEYKNGKEVGTWYRFGDEGHLLSIQKDFKVNKDTVLLFGSEKYVYPYKCYTISYYPNGIIQDEGVLLWDEDPELDTAREYGEWKYYDKEGKLIKTKVFK